MIRLDHADSPSPATVVNHFHSICPRLLSGYGREGGREGGKEGGGRDIVENYARWDGPD